MMSSVRNSYHKPSNQHSFGSNYYTQNSQYIPFLFTFIIILVKFILNETNNPKLHTTTT